MHGNEQVINELLGKYVQRLNKSTRQQFLVNVAARRCEDDDSSDSDGSRIVDEVEGTDEVGVSVQQVKVIPRPPRCAAWAPAPTCTDAPALSNLDLHRLSLSGGPGAKTIPPSMPEKEQKPSTASIPRVRSSPLLRRAESFGRMSPAKENFEALHHADTVSSSSYDTNAHRTARLPKRNSLDLRLSKSLSMRSSSFAEVDDDVSVAASVMSTASIQSALYMTTTTSVDNSSNLNVVSNHTCEQLPRLPMRGSYVQATYTKSPRGKKFDMDDTSTVTTEATSMYSSISMSRSISFESAASYEALKADKSKIEASVSSSRVSSHGSRRSELDRLKKLTLIRPTNSESKMNQEKKSLDNFMSKIKNEKKQLDGTNYKVRGESTIDGNEAKQAVSSRTSLKDLKSKRYGVGRVNVTERNTLSVASDRSVGTVSGESRTSSTCSTVEAGNRPTTAVARRALLRRHSMSRARSATRTTTNSSTVEDIGMLTQVQSDTVNASRAVVGRGRPHSMSPLRTTSSRVGSPMVERKDIKKRLPKHCIAQQFEEQKKEATCSVPTPPPVAMETKSSTAMSSRAEWRRSRSVSRSRPVPPPSPTKRSSSTMRTTPSPTVFNADPCMGTPPRSAPKSLANRNSTKTMSTSASKTQPRTAVSDEIATPSISSSPMITSLMKSALVKRNC
jgi:hypothetical protein